MQPTTTDVLAAVTRLTTNVDRFASRLTAIETRLAVLETATEAVRQIQAAHSDRMSAFATQLEAQVQVLGATRRRSDEMSPQEEMNLRAAALLLANIFHGFPSLRSDAVPPGFRRVLETADSFESYLLGDPAANPPPGPPRPAPPR